MRLRVRLTRQMRHLLMLLLRMMMMLLMRHAGASGLRHAACHAR